MEWEQWRCGVNVNTQVTKVTKNNFSFNKLCVYLCYIRRFIERDGENRRDVRYRRAGIYLSGSRGALFVTLNCF